MALVRAIRKTTAIVVVFLIAETESKLLFKSLLSCFRSKEREIRRVSSSA